MVGSCRARLVLGPPYNKMVRLERDVTSCLGTFQGVAIQPRRVVVNTKARCLSDLLVRLLKGRLGCSIRGPKCRGVTGVCHDVKTYCRCVRVRRSKPGMRRLRRGRVGIVRYSPSRRCPAKVMVPVDGHCRLLN